MEELIHGKIKARDSLALLRSNMKELGPRIPDKGYEWDTGIHYVGNSINAHSGSSTGKVLEFLTDGKLKWESMGDLIDVIKIKEKEYLPTNKRRQKRY